MDAESIREYCFKKKQVTESFPFGNGTLVFKIKGKIFLLLVLDQELLKFNAKCDPSRAIELREQYEYIQPGYHMNKKLWNTITVNSTIPSQLIKRIIDDSYNLVINSLSKKEQEELL
jgi:predicted DNA-binding protein (MmcQ/YjbR family)